MKNNRFPTLTITISLLMVCLVDAQPVASVYYLCVGSVHYTNDFELYAPGFNGLLNLDAAETSVQKIEYLLKRYGAIGGEIVLSQPGEYVDSLKIFNALSKVITRVKREEEPNPFLIFYYAGHGFSGPEVEALFLPPGNFVENPEKLDMMEWQKFAISPLAIHEELEVNEIDHMMLLDCCYEGRQQPDRMPDKSVVKELGIERIETLMQDMNLIFGAMNRMVGPNPVIFSAPVEESVKTVPLPDDGNLYVGPLCRRTDIIYRIMNEKELSLEQFVTLLTSSELDSITIPAVTHVVFDRTGEWLIKQY